ncbi:MAG TPA: PHB depolymerase family esterase [Ilumatobacteraceae bacterium]|nr:PHB depolymerase family esterase [Ilumatobacteraceae bacterium]HRB03383.1 PHB depolymerase family esterase [Ilumatobacteraceae bacterium]
MKTFRMTMVLAVVLVAACSSPAATGPTDPTSTTTSTTTSTSTTSVPETTTVPETTSVPETTTVPETTVALPGIAATGQVIDSTLVTADGRTRVYRIYVPSHLPEGPVPLLLAFHGGTGFGKQFERNSGFDELAEANGFLVVYPDGIGAGADETTNRTWNGGDCCGAAARKNVDDVGFVAQLLDTLEADYDIDTNRVFAAGHSNGGILSYRLACELSDRIVAVGLQSGTLGIDDCSPTRPVSLLHIHGTADTNLPIDGGVGADSAAGVAFTSPRLAVQTFAVADGCAADPTVTGDAANTDLTVDTWSGCAGATEVKFVAVAGAAHSWMGHVPSNPTASPAYQGLDSSYEIVAFLLSHPRTAT